MWKKPLKYEKKNPLKYEKKSFKIWQKWLEKSTNGLTSARSCRNEQQHYTFIKLQIF